MEVSLRFELVRTEMNAFLTWLLYPNKKVAQGTARRPFVSFVKEKQLCTGLATAAVLVCGGRPPVCSILCIIATHVEW